MLWTLFLAAVGWLAAVSLAVAWALSARELRRRRRAAAGALDALDALQRRDYDRALALAHRFLPHDYHPRREADAPELAPPARPRSDAAATTEEVSLAFRRTVLLLHAADRESQAARRELEDVLSSLQDSVLVVDDEARVRFLNPAAQAFFHARAEDVLGARILEALPSFGLESIVCEALRDGQHHSREVALYAPPPSAPGAAWHVDRRLELGADARQEPRREVLLRVAPVRRADGGVSGAVAIVQDLTELRRLERVRRDFVANASHELRTPIANIRAAAETILDASDDPAMAQRFLPRLVDEAERLSRLVSDLLDLARADSSGDMARSRVDLSRIAREVAARLGEKAASQGVEVRVEASEPVWVMGEAGGLEQVAFNLLDNALMYTPSGGGVEVRVAAPNGYLNGHAAGASVLVVDGHADDGHQPERAGVATAAEASLLARAGEASLRVSDTGIGIPSADLPRIFERFYRVDKARSRAQGGTGLGLAIVKHIVERHGGHIRVESQAGEGTTFHVLLPTPTGDFE